MIQLAPRAARCQIEGVTSFRLMSEPLAEPPSPSTSPNLQAANELRAAASGASTKAEELTQSAEEKAKLLKESAAEKAKGLREVATEKTVQFRENASENVQHLRGAAGEQWQDTRLKLREYHADAEDMIRQNPTQCVLAAAAVGFLAGLIFRR